MAKSSRANRPVSRGAAKDLRSKQTRQSKEWLEPRNDGKGKRDKSNTRKKGLGTISSFEVYTKPIKSANIQQSNGTLEKIAKELKKVKRKFYHDPFNPTGNPRFNKLLDRMQQIHDKKNKDYAEDNNPYSNFEFSAGGSKVNLYQVYFVLITTKMARLHELLGKQKVAQNESVDDTLLDLAVYSALLASNLMRNLEVQS